MAAEFDAFATRMTAPLTGLAQVLTGDREAAAALTYTALIRAYAERVPDERRAVTALVRAWLSGTPPLGETAELSFDLELLRRSLDALPEKQRVAVALHHWSGWSTAEIAAVVRRPERAVAADLAAGVADLHVPPPSTVDTQLAALVAAAGPPLVDVAEVAEAGRVQQRQRRRTAVVAGAVLLAVATVATLLMGGGEEKRAIADTRTWSLADLRSVPVVDDRARRLTAQLAAARDDVLPGITDLQPGAGRRPPLEFATSPEWGSTTTYFAEARFGSTLLILFVQSYDGVPYPACTDYEVERVCTPREFPDGTVAEVSEVVVRTELGPTALSLIAQRPDGTVLNVIADSMGGLPELTVEDLFRFATVFTY